MCSRALIVWDRYWIPTTDATYGVCFTFNTAYNKLDPAVPREASLTGVNNGPERES